MKVTIHPGSVLAGAAILASLFALTGMDQAATKIGEQRSSDAQWPPRAEDIVSINNEDVSGQIPGPISVPGVGQSVAVYQVPADKWLVITNYAMNSTCCDPAWIVERHGGTVTSKIDVQDWAANASDKAPLGWTFRPGSTVEILAAQGGVNNLSFSLLGYLRKD